MFFFSPCYVAIHPKIQIQHLQDEQQGVGRDADTWNMQEGLTQLIVKLTGLLYWLYTLNGMDIFKEG